MQKTLDGKIAWVTGAGSGIGLAGAKALAEAGACVVLSARHRDALEAVAAEIRACGGQAEVASLDVADADAVERVAAAIEGRHGRIDILVNSAGINTATRYWRDQTIEGWDRVSGVNLSGTFYCSRAAIERMRRLGDGIVITISSWAGVANVPLLGPAYSSTKHAAVSLSETINMEEGRNGIRSSVICPGEVNTPILDTRPHPPSPEVRSRMLKMEDIGRTIRWLAEQPPHVCVNQMIISPTENRIYLGTLEEND